MTTYYQYVYKILFQEDHQKLQSLYKFFSKVERKKASTLLKNIKKICKY